MGWIPCSHSLSPLLVVIFQIHVNRLSVSKPEGNSPVARYPNAPNTAAITVKLVEIIARQVNVSRAYGIL